MFEKIIELFFVKKTVAKPACRTFLGKKRERKVTDLTAAVKEKARSARGGGKTCLSEFFEGLNGLKVSAKTKMVSAALSGMPGRKELNISERAESGVTAVNLYSRQEYAKSGGFCLSRDVFRNSSKD